MNIGKSALESGVPSKLIRYYESIGLIAAPHRSEGGYRLYSERDVNTLLRARHEHSSLSASRTRAWLLH
jgi:MerR family transcriptional regulator, copper efflux regulator